MNEEWNESSKRTAGGDASVKSSSAPCYWGARAILGSQCRLLAVLSTVKEMEYGSEL